MQTADTPINNPDPFDLQRFVHAQETVYTQALAELCDGRKRTHWMWFIFPQIDGLGHSATTKHYAIKSRAEARQYLAHPVLGARVTECAETILKIKGRSAYAIFGSPDDMKLKSSMTLFATVADSGAVFEQVLTMYFQGQRDTRTLSLLAQHTPD